MQLPCQVLMALVNVNLLPKGSATDMSLVPRGHIFDSRSRRIYSFSPEVAFETPPVHWFQS